MCSSSPPPWTLSSGINLRNQNCAALEYFQVSEFWTTWNHQNITRKSDEEHGSQFLTYIILETLVQACLSSSQKVNGIEICVDMTDFPAEETERRGKQADLDKAL